MPDALTYEADGSEKPYLFQIVSEGTVHRMAFAWTSLAPN